MVGFDDIEDGAFTTPSFTTVSPDKHQIATSALQCLADRVYGRPRHLPTRQVIAAHRLVVRESTGG